MTSMQKAELNSGRPFPARRQNQSRCFRNPLQFLKANLATSLTAALLVALSAACSKSGGEKEAGTPGAEQSQVRRGTNGETIVILDAGTQKRAGLQTAVPSAAQWQPEAKGFGRVLDPAPLAALMADLVTAHVAMETSQREFDRLRTLAEQNNASARALQTAEAAARRDQLLVESLRTKLALGWGKAALNRDDPPAFVKSLVNGDSSLVRIDLPAGESLRSAPISARLVLLNDPERPVTAGFFDAATSVDPQTQGQGFLFLIKGAPPGLPPGSSLTGYLQVAGDKLSGVVVPRSAVVRHEGKGWVYLQTGEDAFVRHEIELDHPTEAGWFVPKGVTAGDRIVVSGAQAVFSVELNGSGYMSGARD